MKMLIDGVKYDSAKCELIAKDEQQNPRGRNTGTKTTTLFKTKNGLFLLLVEYSFKGKPFDSAFVKVSKQKAFDFAKSIANLDTLEMFFADQLDGGK